MKIYSWNMLFRNKRQEEALAFIREADADIFCLQEVPDSFLTRLQELPYHLAHAVDVERDHPKKETLYVVILSRYPIERLEAFPFPDYSPHLPLRTRIFIRLMRPLYWSTIHNRHGMYVDLSINGTALRVFNLHLVLAHPLWRLREFEEAMIRKDPVRATIVCGDFNIIESLHITPLNWLSAGGVSDVFSFRRERTAIEVRFGTHELSNPLKGKTTHGLSRSQLDHILLSPHFSIKESQVLTPTFGSDHHPIFVEATTG